MRDEATHGDKNDSAADNGKNDMKQSIDEDIVMITL